MTPGRPPWPAWLAGHAVLALLATWPAAARLGTHVPGYVGFENTPQTLWLYTQWKAFLAQAWSGAGPAEGLLSWPARLVDAWWQTSQFAFRVSMANGLDFLPTLPLEALAGVPAYYGLKILVILALDGLAASALAWRLWGRPLAAFLAGALFAFNPFMLYLVATGRVMESITLFLPLFAADLFQGWRSGDRAAFLRAGLWLGLGASTYWFYGHFMLIFLAAFLAWHVPGALRDGLPARLGGVAASLGVALLVALPAGLPYLCALLRGEHLPGGVRVGPGMDPITWLLQRQLPAFSCDLGYGFQLATPMPGGEATPPWWLPTQLTSSVTLSAAAAGALLLWPRRAGFWAVAFLVFYTLPLGPVLKVGGQVVRVHGDPVALPYAALVQGFPLFYKLMFPNQAMVLWLLAAALLAALPVAVLEERGRRALALGLVAGLLLTVGQEMVLRRMVPLPSSPLAPVMETYARVPATGFVYAPANRWFWLTEGEPTAEFYFGSDLYHVDGHVALHGRKSLWSRAQTLAGTDTWLYSPPSLLENRFLAWLLDPTRPAGAGLEEERARVRRAGYSHVVVLERLCSHTVRGGAYTTDAAAGGRRYEAICAALERVLGPAVATGEDPCWDLGIDRDQPVETSYRMAVFAVGAGR